MRISLLLPTLSLFSLAAMSQPHLNWRKPPRVELGAFDLNELTVSQLQKRMEAGKETSRSLVDKYLARIEAIDRNGPALNSVIELNPDARTIADTLDDERKAGKVRGPLHGIPVLIKDNIATADKMKTTAGSLALLDAPAPPRDAFLVSQLRKAGAVILGKTNLSEWANMRSTHSSSGWSGRGGQTKNPYALDRNPSGSSSGSAVAVSANLAPIAVGTETDGSIVSPASANGVVGIKPTVGLVSRSGIIPISHTQDTAGPIARRVEDAALLLAAISGSDALDRATDLSDSKKQRDYTSSLIAGGLKGARIGVVRKNVTGYHAATDQIFEAAIHNLKELGAEIIDPADIPTIDEFDAGELDVLLYDFKTDLNKYLAELGPNSPVHTLEDLIVFNETHRAAEMPVFGQELLLKAQKKGSLSDKAYRDALAKDTRLSREKGIDAVMNKFKLDALIAPTMGPAWLTDPINGDPRTGGSSSSLAAVAGYPAITVPAGFISGLPVGITFFGRAWSEAELIKLAYSYEQGTMHRQAPSFLESARP